ncbi:hypothetical protein K9M74_00315 [Candidatus Woesearchaeota archaeon]|nr:hypothetical protein [Candidatus Woesearchaeota archaeon]
MDELLNHKKDFERIVTTYNLDDEVTAGKIADFMFSHPQGLVSVSDFAEEFSLPEKEAHIFLSFILKGLQFKEDVIDKK